MFGTMLICVGVLLVASGGVAVGLHRAIVARVARMLGRRPRPIAQMVHDGPVGIDGAVLAAEQGTLIAPCSGEVAVWFRLRLRNSAAAGDGSQLWVTVADEDCGTTFHIDDGSGIHAQVRASGALFMAKTTGFRKLPPEAQERVRLFLETRGNEFWMADEYEEECLRPGDRVRVAGFARREPGSALPILYRNVPSSQLIVEATPGHELVVATPEAVRQTRGVYRTGWIAVVVGLAMIAAGAVARGAVE
jgi:hypothetical protein